MTRRLEDLDEYVFLTETPQPDEVAFSQELSKFMDELPDLMRRIHGDDYLQPRDERLYRLKLSGLSNAEIVRDDLFIELSGEAKISRERVRQLWNVLKTRIYKFLVSYSRGRLDYALDPFGFEEMVKKAA